MINSVNLMLFIIVFPLIGTILGFLIGMKSEKYRDIFNIAMTGITFLAVMMLYKWVSHEAVEIRIPYVMGTGLHLKLNVFRYIFVWLTSFIWFLITIYSTQYLISYKNRNRYYAFFMLTLWSTIGIFISENFLNLFTFFEIMSFASYPLIIHDEDTYSHEAGDTYIVMAVAGGLVLLMGIFLLYDYTQTLEISKLSSKMQNIGNVKYLISALIIGGFGVKAGMIPLHIWLPKAHPAAPAPASAILSGILLKTGVFGILITSEIMMEGDFIVSSVILVLGFATMCIGGFLAMFQRNIKRILAYSSMSQIGYILVGLGLMGILKDHKSIALYGTIYHIINHVIFKVLLFMGAGIVYMVLHELSINEIGGFGKNKNVLKIIFLIGLFAIIGMPGFNGFISKTLLHHALADAHKIYHNIWFTIGEWVFTISSSFTAAYLLKIFVAVFIDESDHHADREKAKITKRALLPMAVLAVLIIYIGLRPNAVMDLISKAVPVFKNVHPIETMSFYTIENLKSSIISISIGVTIYMLFVRKVLRQGTGIHWQYVNPALNWFSIEKNIYIPVFTTLIHISSILLKIVDESLIKIVTFCSDSLTALGKMEIDQGRDIINKAKENTTSLIKSKMISVDFSESSTVTTNIKNEIYKMYKKMNSVTYSIYIFGVVLAVCLIALVY